MEKKLKLQIPKVPDFITVEMGDKKSKMSVGGLDDNELRQIAK